MLRRADSHAECTAVTCPLTWLESSTCPRRRWGQVVVAYREVQGQVGVAAVRVHEVKRRVASSRRVSRVVGEECVRKVAPPTVVASVVNVRAEQILERGVHALHETLRLVHVAVARD